MPPFLQSLAKSRKRTSLPQHNRIEGEPVDLGSLYALGWCLKIFDPSNDLDYISPLVEQKAHVELE